MSKLTKLEVEFWLDVNSAALKRTQQEIEVLNSQKYRSKVKKALKETTRKNLLAKKRMLETELTEKVAYWKSALHEFQT